MDKFQLPTAEEARKLSVSKACEMVKKLWESTDLPLFSRLVGEWQRHQKIECPQNPYNLAVNKVRNDEAADERKSHGYFLLFIAIGGIFHAIMSKDFMELLFHLIVLCLSISEFVHGRRQKAQWKDPYDTPYQRVKDFLVDVCRLNEFVQVVAPLDDIEWYRLESLATELCRARVRQIIALKAVDMGGRHEGDTKATPEPGLINIETLDSEFESLYLLLQSFGTNPPKRDILFQSVGGELVRSGTLKPRPDSTVEPATP